MNTFERSLRHLVPALLAGIVITASAAPQTGPIEEAVYRAHIARLASDEFGGRKPGTEGEKLTLDYLEAEFRKLGLKPGNGASFLQEVPMVEITAGSDAALKFATAGVDANLKFREDMVIWTKRVKPAESMSASPMVFVGHGVTAPEYGWDDYAGIDMHGKTAVILINDPGFATGDATLFRGRAMTYYGRWTYKFEEAARRGATGAIIVHQTEPAAYGWDTVVNSWSTPQLDRGHRGWKCGSRRHRRLDHRVAGATAVCRQWHHAGRGGEARQHTWISRRTAEERGQRVGSQHRSGARVRTISRPSSREASGRTNTSSTWRIGTIWGGSRTVPATAS